MDPRRPDVRAVAEAAAEAGDVEDHRGRGPRNPQPILPAEDIVCHMAFVECQFTLHWGGTMERSETGGRT